MLYSTIAFINRQSGPISNYLLFST